MISRHQLEPDMQGNDAISRNAICLCTDRNLLIPAMFVADAVKSRLASSLNDYDVLVFAQPSEVNASHVHWMNERGIGFRGDLDVSGLSSVKQFSGRLTEATLMRLRLPEHLADEYDRILYLDSDLTIHDDVGAIFSLDTGPFEIAAATAGRVMAGLIDCERENRLKHFKALGMTEPYGYFNAGVLYIDVRKWNAASLGVRAMDFIRNNQDLCALPDEDALNALLDGKIAELSPIWNMRPPTCRGAPHTFGKPVIVHHMGDDKPWRRYGYHKRLFPDRSAYKLYEAFLANTPWNGWLSEQWNGKDLRANIVWEIRRITRRLRGRLDEPTAGQRRAALGAARRFNAEHAFADVDQGLVTRSNGMFRLAASS